MKKLITLLVFGFLGFVISCKDTYYGSLESSGSQYNTSGNITAGEWNDLDNWDFWKNLLNESKHSERQRYWQFNTSNRISILLMDNNQPVVDATVELFKDGNLEWTSKTDNNGKAELWISLFNFNQSIDVSEYSLSIDGQQMNTQIKLFKNGVNEIEFRSNKVTYDRVQISFIVDATGSMGDELEFLKDDMENVIRRFESNNIDLKTYTSCVFYRDKGEDYVVKKSDFSDDLNRTVKFINGQSAYGGTDNPEAVHTALSTAIQELGWYANARTRIAFLLLDAPPHHVQEVIEDLHSSINKISEKGIKIIPISSSGIDDATEFLLRFFSISTNGTYVFITGHSGIGRQHKEPNVGNYQTEKLNDLMVRLINKYSD